MHREAKKGGAKMLNSNIIGKSTLGKGVGGMIRTRILGRLRGRRGKQQGYMKRGPNGKGLNVAISEKTTKREERGAHQPGHGELG